MGLIKFIFIAIIIYYLFKLVARYLMPYLLTRFVRKTQEKMSQHQQGGAQEQKKKSGEISVDFVPKDKGKGNPNKSELGEYVDFEDVDE